MSRFDFQFECIHFFCGIDLEDKNNTNVSPLSPLSPLTQKRWLQKSERKSEKCEQNKNILLENQFRKHSQRLYDSKPLFINTFLFTQENYSIYLRQQIVF